MPHTQDSHVFALPRDASRLYGKVIDILSAWDRIDGELYAPSPHRGFSIRVLRGTICELNHSLKVLVEEPSDCSANEAMHRIMVERETWPERVRFDAAGTSRELPFDFARKVLFDYLKYGYEPNVTLVGDGAMLSLSHGTDRDPRLILKVPKSADTRQRGGVTGRILAICKSHRLKRLTAA